MSALEQEPFLWGTAVSAHQVEGDNRHNDWWAFERDRRLAPSGEACAFRHLFEDDLDRARALGTNAFRLSVEWSRLEPEPGRRDPDAVRYYDRLIDACLARGLEPVVTLVHFTLPRWCSEAGGWLAPATHEAFRRHVRFVAERLTDRVRLFVTINEPNVQAGAGYLGGLFPPGRRLRIDLEARCLARLAEAHRDAYRILHERASARGRSVAVCASPHVVGWQRARWDPAGLVWRAAQRFNWGFLDRPEVRDAIDLVGVNYFMGLRADVTSVLRLAGILRFPVRAGTSDMGWPIAPGGLEEVLREAWRRYRKPILVTENGVADACDALRPAFIHAHLDALERARAAGVPVRGYCHWSLVDNFEWHAGYGPRFGLYAVDYRTQERRERASAQVYRERIACAQCAAYQPAPTLEQEVPA